MRITPALLFLLASSALAQAPTELNLIPEPVELRMEPGTLDLGCPWQVDVSGSASKELFDLLQAELAPLQMPKTKDCLLPLRIQFNRIQPDTLLPDEWHSVHVAPDGISVTAPSEEGLFRASRTLIQLLEQGRGTGNLPCLTITDWPRFQWRGMHLDACRHFWSVEFTKKYIDLLARYKMNRFHWHLTEDQGWRIEIKKYPKLTEVGAWRSGSQVGPYSRREYDSIPYGGFYTQEQIRDVVAYAAARHITVVPEIEMPGHALAALASYPQLGCTGGPYKVQKGWGVFDDVFCAGNDSVFTMLEDVLTEVMDLFPSELIHIGGDECPKERWKTCAECQSRMKTHGLKDEHELQSYFIQRIEKFVNSKGRKIIGWDEILEGGLAPNAAVMSWRGTEGGVAAAKQKHNVVMSPGSHCYFDHYQGDPANEPLAFGGYTTLQKVYGYEPIPAELKPEEAKYILGAQGNVWTEYILTPEHVEYMAVPRMLALAEVLWTPKAKRNEADFIRRLENEFPELEAMKVNASKSMYQVRVTPEQGPNPGEIAVDSQVRGRQWIQVGRTDNLGSRRCDEPNNGGQPCIEPAGDINEPSLTRLDFSKAEGLSCVIENLRIQQCHRPPHHPQRAAQRTLQRGRRLHLGGWHHRAREAREHRMAGLARRRHHYGGSGQCAGYQPHRHRSAERDTQLDPSTSNRGLQREQRRQDLHTVVGAITPSNSS
ncbi:MAG: beta-N-acetylhexosaminidase [Flavobacteriales bacterium]|nr:beta-N-acetylhexosaminidase [Flavobacteriales bacterium]